MRHRRFTKRIGTDSEHARANLRNLAIALVKYGKIKTTVFKAKQLRPYIEKLITFGKRGDLHARRIVVSRLNNKEAAKKIFDDIAKRFMNREGGYTRIVRAGYRNGDCAPMAYISFVEEEVISKTEKEKAPEQKTEVEELKEKVEKEMEEEKEAESSLTVESEEKNVEVENDNKPE
jgi:large subunit ribosomal protein L17